MIYQLKDKPCIFLYRNGSKKAFNNEIYLVKAQCKIDLGNECSSFHVAIS